MFNVRYVCRIVELLLAILVPNARNLRLGLDLGPIPVLWALAMRMQQKYTTAIYDQGLELRSWHGTLHIGILMESGMFLFSLRFTKLKVD